VVEATELRRGVCDISDVVVVVVVVVVLGDEMSCAWEGGTRATKP